MRIEQSLLCTDDLCQVTMSSFVLYVKPTAGGDRFSVDAVLSMTVAELKEQVQAKSKVVPEEPRLIYKGQVLKDERKDESYGELAAIALAQIG